MTVYYEPLASRCFLVAERQTFVHALLRGKGGGILWQWGSKYDLALLPLPLVDASKLAAHNPIKSKRLHMIIPLVFRYPSKTVELVDLVYLSNKPFSFLYSLSNILKFILSFRHLRLKSIMLTLIQLQFTVGYVQLHIKTFIIIIITFHNPCGSIWSKAKISKRNYCKGFVLL